MLHEVRRAFPGAAAALLTTTNEAVDRVAMHGVRRTLVEAQAREAGLPLCVVPLPWPCSNDEYEARMRTAVEGFRDQGFTHVAFGDLCLEDVRRYREERLASSGLAPVFPIWKTASTGALAGEMIAGGLRARVSTVDLSKLDRSFVGREFDAAFLADLPPGVDPCGENGEFHTFAYAGPMFARPIAIAAGEIVERDGFAYGDLVEAGA